MTPELQTVLDGLIQKGSKVITFTVPLDTDDETKEAVLFLRKPDKATRGIVGKLVGQGKSEQAVQAVLKNLYLGGDPLDFVFSNDDAMASAELGVVKLLEVQAAAIKKN